MTRVLVVGLPGSGKSTVAAAIGAATAWPCLDSDALLERTAGASARQLLAHGAERLQAAESHVLTLLVSMPGPFVSCVAAGTVRDAAARERLRHGGHVVWVRTSLTTLARRAARAPGGGGGEAALQALARECEPHYADVADHVLEMDRLTPAAAAREVVAALPRD